MLQPESLVRRESSEIVSHFTRFYPILNYKVIGLDKHGYGRILSECMFTAKIMYCLWVTLAEKDDNFVIETTKPLPEKYNTMSQEEQIKFIKERILGKSNEELVQVSACIPKFTFRKRY